jgi:hypothetical protein
MYIHLSLNIWKISVGETLFNFYMLSSKRGGKREKDRERKRDTHTERERERERERICECMCAFLCEQQV